MGMFTFVSATPHLYRYVGPQVQRIQLVNIEVYKLLPVLWFSSALIITYIVALQIQLFILSVY